MGLGDAICQLLARLIGLIFKLRARLNSSMIQLYPRVLSLPATRYASFAIALPLYQVFDYAIDEQDPTVPGTRYQLPFGHRNKIGILLESADSSVHDLTKIKTASEPLDQRPIVDTHMLSLVRWIADYYLQPVGEVLFHCLPAYLRKGRARNPARIKTWRLTMPNPATNAECIDLLQQRSPRQFEICEALRGNANGLNAAGLKAVNLNWHAVIRALEAKQLVEWSWASPRATYSASSSASASPASPKVPQLSDEQQRVTQQIESHLQSFVVHLIDGVTGSGKTEIYLRLIASTLGRQQQVIYLVPEIGLTNQLIERVQARFGDCFVTSHSGLTEVQRYQAWEGFSRGDASIMLGTRSSLFSQCPRLGLIIVDEEHDHSYRQQDGVRYHARDVAIKRAQMLDIPILLGSATPSLESIANCTRKTYHRFQLDQRPTQNPPPRIELLEVRENGLKFGCGQQTLDRIEQHLQAAGQVLIYLNRRGFAPVVMCHECSWQAQCQNCDSRLTLHQSVDRLVCHHCGYKQGLPSECPSCAHPTIKHYGIGTEQLEQGLVRHFPETTIMRIDRDVITSREALRSRIEQLKTGEPCILIGTQMIAKGHDYPGITLSVILDADQALFSASYRASERLLQTLYQVAGRAGRGKRKGEAILQTGFPQHPMMLAVAQRDYRLVAQDLLQEREMLGLPPYARVVMFRADGLNLKSAIEKLEAIKAIISAQQELPNISCIGPIPALMTRRIGRYRAQLCILAADYQRLRGLLARAMPEIQRVSSTQQVYWSVDVDAFDL